MLHLTEVKQEEANDDDLYLVDPIDGRSFVSGFCRVLLDGKILEYFDNVKGKCVVFLNEIRNLYKIERA